VYILSLFRDGIFIPVSILILLPRTNAIDISALLWGERGRERGGEREEGLLSDENVG